MILNFKSFAINLIVLSSYIRNSSGYMVGTNPYHRREILDDKGKYQLEWVTDLTSESINFTVIVETNGTVGFGLNRDGKMAGADIVIGGVYPDGQTYFKDYHAVDNDIPEEDLSQDWTFHSAAEDGNWTVLKFSRKFDTCDPQDYPITENRISIIWFYTEEDTLTYHHSNRGEYQVYLLFPDYSPPVVEHPNVGAPKQEEVVPSSPSDLQTWTVTTRFNMPAEDTTYWCTMHKGPTLSKKHHIIGHEILFPNEENRLHVHHFTIYKCNSPQGGPSASQMFAPFVGQQGQLCYSMSAPTGPMPTQYCTQYYEIADIGMRPFFYPPQAGLPFGEMEDEYYLLQVHYDNLKKLPNVQVELSIKSYYTPELRPNEAGILLLRHNAPGMTPSLLIPPKSPNFQMRGLCGSECTREVLPEEGIQVVAANMHMHNTGSAARIQHFRGNEELKWILSDDNYAFDFQQIFNFQREVRILPGDVVTIECTFDNTRFNGTTVGGFSSQQEMCDSFLHYYSSRTLNYTICSSEIISEEAREKFLGIRNVTWSSQDLEYLVDQPDELAGLKVTEVSDNYVNWDSERRSEFQKFILAESHVNVCSRELYSFPASVGSQKLSNSGTDNDENVRQVKFPSEITPYNPPRSCSFQ